MAAGAKPGR
jgi:hypothetical protein